MKKGIVFLVLATVCLVAQDSHGEVRRPIVAVFEINAEGVEIEKVLVKSLTEYLSTAISEGVVYRVVPPEDVRKALQEKQKETYKLCYDQACQIELGRELAANKSLSTNILLLGDKCVVASKLYDLKTQTTDISAKVTGPCTDSGLMESIDKVAAKIKSWGSKEAVGEPRKAEVEMPATKSEARLGWLSIESEPKGLLVSINGVKEGETPLVRLEKEPGEYEVLVSSPCYKEASKKVQVVNGKEESVSVSLEKKKGTVDVRAHDLSGKEVAAEVYVDGKKIGDTPGKYSVPICSKELEFKHSDYGLEKRKLSFGEGEKLDIEIVLEGKVVVETPARHPQEIGMSPSPVTVIDRNEIEASGASNIADVMRLVPGMDVVVTSPFYASISSRLDWTNENNRYLVLLDGRETNVDMIGFTPFTALPVSVEDIERIEVTRGPGSPLYGSDALSGVVSITTKRKPERTTASLNFLGGDANMIIAGARASTRIGGVGMSISGGYETSAAFADTEIEGRETWRVNAGFDYTFLDSHTLILDLGVSDGSGPVLTEVGTMDMSLGLRVLRLAYESERIRGQIYWSWASVTEDPHSPINYNGDTLAEFMGPSIDSHTFDAELQWELPKFWDPLLVIVGAAGRLFNVSSEQLLDGETFADITSSKYHQPGLDYSEKQVGTFLHAEIAPSDWLRVTGGIRYDYNTLSGDFASPRFSAVFVPYNGHFLRFGVSRAFRKPSFKESHLNMMVSFPQDSPITGPGRDSFQEFMSKTIGNSDLENEELWSFGVGYLGRFIEDMLTVELNLYYNIYSNWMGVIKNVVDDSGLPDLVQSYCVFENIDDDLQIFGFESSIRFKPAEYISLIVSWTHREVLDETANSDEIFPTDLVTIGGRFWTELGPVGGMYLFHRSKFWNRSVENPDGILAPYLEDEMEFNFLLMGKLGWKFHLGTSIELEVGGKFFLPMSPSEDSNFKYRESGGGRDTFGYNYGGMELARVFLGYLKGNF